MMNGTQTTMGFIPNLKHNGFELVAKLDIGNTQARMQDPIIRFGRVVYALPGGGEFVGGRVETCIRK